MTFFVHWPQFEEFCIGKHTLKLVLFKLAGHEGVYCARERLFRTSFYKRLTHKEGRKASLMMFLEHLHPGGMETGLPVVT